MFHVSSARDVDEEPRAWDVVTVTLQTRLCNTVVDNSAAPHGELSNIISLRYCCSSSVSFSLSLPGSREGATYGRRQGPALGESTAPGLNRNDPNRVLWVMGDLNVLRIQLLGSAPTNEMFQTMKTCLIFIVHIYSICTHTVG